MKILIGCEESQTTTKAFRNLGYEAYSCDLLPCSGGHPEWHLQMDVFKAIDIIKPKMAIFHPPCTFLAGSGAQWLSHPDDTKLSFEERRPHPAYPSFGSDMQESVRFVKALYDSNIDHIAIENPVGLLATRWKKADQIVQPYHFGDEATKTTCLWLKNLPHLQHSNIVGKGERWEWIDSKTGKKKSQPLWYYQALSQARTKQERQTLRSKTFPGMANAFAKQWSEHILNPENKTAVEQQSQLL